MCIGEHQSDQYTKQQDHNSSLIMLSGRPTTINTNNKHTIECLFFDDVCVYCLLLYRAPIVRFIVFFLLISRPYICDTYVLLVITSGDLFICKILFFVFMFNEDYQGLMLLKSMKNTPPCTFPSIILLLDYLSKI